MIYNYIINKLLVPLLIITVIQFNTEKKRSPEKPDPPKAVYKLGKTDGSLTRLPDGTLMLFKLDGSNLLSMTSKNGINWSSPKVEIRK